MRQTTASDPPLHHVPRLGEELPIFCERCGYILHGLPQVRCDHCAILQFHCPECGHHQPINTPRPTVQRALARLRAWGVGAWLFVKLNWFGWLLFAWLVFGYETGYVYQNFGGAVFNTEELVFLFLLAFLWGAIGRMLLLRWRNGALAGGALALITCAAMAGGFAWRMARWHANLSVNPSNLPMLLTAACGIFVGAVTAWPIWSAAALILLPRRASQRLLQWQCALSDPDTDHRDHEPGVPV